MTEEEVSTERGSWPLSLTTPYLAVVLAVTVFAVAMVFLDLPDGEGPPTVRSLENVSSLAVITAIAAGVSLLFARRNPVPALVAVLACRLFVTSSVGNELELAPAAAVALYLVARTGDRRARLSLAIGLAVISSLILAGLDDDEFHTEFLGEGAQMLLAIAVGDGARTRADRLQDKIDAEAETRVQAERLRIARDLHDVVAHGLSIIAVQSGVAAHVLDRNPQ